MTPILQLSTNIMEGNLDKVWVMTKKLGIEMKEEEKQLREKNLFRNVFKKWINAAEALLEMIITKLPSPK